MGAYLSWPTAALSRRGCCAAMQCVAPAHPALGVLPLLRCLVHCSLAGCAALPPAFLLRNGARAV